MTNPKYGYVKTLKDISFDDAEKKVRDALMAEGFGILTEIDFQATMKKKLDADVRPYKILGACNPPLAKRGVEAESHLGLLLPCNVVVQEGEDGIDISMMNPGIMVQMVENNSELNAVAEEADAKLKRAMGALD